MINKAPTDIAGFDHITAGGLPRGCTTLIEGGPGSGKTVFALQALVNGARNHGEPAVFVAFEENARRIVANAATFGWNLPELTRERLFILDAHISPDQLTAGSFDFGGLLAILGAKIDEIGAKRIALDAVDVVLALFDDPVAARRELHRLHEWLLEREMTAIITAKATKDPRGSVNVQPYDFMQFMVDCAVELMHTLVHDTSQRSLRIAKYRGSAFEENAMPLVIGPGGMEIAYTRSHDVGEVPVTSERLSSGVVALDAMLGGGIYRGASVLLTGAPGTAKTTLAGAFAVAACGRGERTLFVSFDSRSDEVVRNLASVGLDLGSHAGADGLLRMYAARAITGSPEIHLMRLKQQAREHAARCLVIDPMSALAKSGDQGHATAERLIEWAKAEGITLLCTSLLGEQQSEGEGSPLKISTLADTWIHLDYVAHAGERNRALSIVKSRGTGHSNQVRELLLADDGVTLADVYTAGGEVLMGTLRWAKERSERLARAERAAGAQRRRRQLEAEAAELEARIARLAAELEQNRSEELELTESELRHADESARAESRLPGRRSADTVERYDDDPADER